VLPALDAGALEIVADKGHDDLTMGAMIAILRE
jgi:hypothetical protein